MKTESKLYPPSARENARRNIERYEWARAERDRAVERAERYVSLSDEFLWEWVPEQTISRSRQVNQPRVCPICGRGLSPGGGPKFIHDAIRDRWRIRCATCNEIFPKNDFAAFYKSGKDESFLFDPARADRSLLVNRDSPESGFQVDDGIGWKDVDGEAFFFIGYCGHAIWAEILRVLTAFSEAYLLTDDRRYAHKAGILLDRVADVYPSMDMRPWHKLGHYNSHGGSGWGKIFGCIWETGVAKSLATAYDVVFPGLEGDDELIAFLSKRASLYRLPGDKSCVAGVRAHIEEDIVREMGRGVINRDLRGNHGMHQSAMAVAAVVLDEPETSEEWIRWIFRDGPSRNGMDKTPSSGGDLLRVLANLVDRDGMGDEASPGYNSIWPSQFLLIAEILQKSERFRHLNRLNDSPKLRKMYDTPIELVCLGRFIPSIGDSGRTGSPRAEMPSLQVIERAFAYWKGSRQAQIVHFLNGNSSNGLHGGIFEEEPDLLGAEVDEIVRREGPLKLESVNLNGYGYTALKSGEGERERALWIYYGRSAGHGHQDTLNLGLYGFGVDMLPDLGYPEHTGAWPNRLAWTDVTTSHNTVVVGRRRQEPIWAGHLRLFSTAPGCKMVEVSAPKVYEKASLYCRTTALIDISASDSYAVDVFRVAGGQDHRFSFHAAEGEVSVEGLELVTQETGTYAGPEVPYGEPYDGEYKWGYRGSGFQWLYDVRRDLSPESTCSIEWQIQDTWKVWTEPRDVRLRLTMLDPTGEVALAHGDPPQNKPGNPRRLTYMLAGGKPNEHGASTFISIIEPFETQRKIRSISRVKVEPEEENSPGFRAVALKIECADGRVDYVISALDGSVLRLVDGQIEFAGRFAALSVKDGTCVGAHLVAGTRLAGFGVELTRPLGELQGTITGMSREPELPSWVETDLEISDESLVGRWILIENDGARDAAYRIEGQSQGKSGLRLDLGKITLARGYVASETDERQFIYDFEEGARFTIPLDAVRTQ